MSSAAVKALDALIVLNEGMLTVEQIAGFVARMRNGEKITEEELETKYERNIRFAQEELKSLENL